MAIQISTLWNQVKFKKLSAKAKYLYIHLATNPNIDYTGVVAGHAEDIARVMGVELIELREASTELIKEKMLYIVSDDDGVYFIIPKHFSTIGKSDSTIEKVKSLMKTQPEVVAEKLVEIGIRANEMIKVFVKPTAEEIESFAISKGHIVNGQTIIDYYESMPKSNKDHWYDRNHARIMNWQAKLSNVWFKKSNMIQRFDNPPKGLEGFYIKDGESVLFPEYWGGGIPRSKSLTIDVKMKKEFKDWCKKHNIK